MTRRIGLLAALTACLACLATVSACCMPSPVGHAVLQIHRAVQAARQARARIAFAESAPTP